MRQGNDAGSQYRSVIFYGSDGQRAAAEESRTAYQQKLAEAGYGEITTEIVPAGEFYFAEDYHQQYLSDAKNPNEYCLDHGTSVHGLAARPRFHVTRTPVHASWLNMVFFSILQRRLLRRGEFTSRAHLAGKILEFICSYDDKARPFRWSYDGRPLKAA